MPTVATCSPHPVRRSAGVAAPRRSSRPWGRSPALVGCSGDSPPEQPDAEPTASSTPLADYDTESLTLVRGEFCSRVAQPATTTLLGAEATETASRAPGRRLPGSRDISNEFGCSRTTPSVTARARVFAPPITRERANDFAGEIVGMKCEELEDAPALGDPGVAQRCGLNTGATLTGFYGSVGDARIGCEVDRGASSSTSATEPAESARSASGASPYSKPCGAPEASRPAPYVMRTGCSNSHSP
ncbi:hypothetical protein [Nocardioides sp. B-3]|uniref:hypothetical protein n=1 Tax=Nocardioides sp. B-3 TaxID=2895565 RepID=UPI002152F035|nr:hypothetical protein [Nocardioides sp. B-3]UUZ60133.1 hypothetical protein LP418_04000 [Nocardioides sp. B-3]